MEIGIVGLGQMGASMARRLARGGVRVVCYDTAEAAQKALAAEKQAISDYGKRIRKAEALGDIGLKVALENHVADETRHKEEIEQILVGWNEQNRERVRNEDRWQDDGGQG